MHTHINKSTMHAYTQERLLAERLDTVCTHVRERITKAQSLLHPESRHARRTSSSSGVHARDRDESEDTLLRGRLEDERAARRSAEVRAGEWERRVEALKDLVQVCVCVCVCVVLKCWSERWGVREEGGGASRIYCRCVCVCVCVCMVFMCMMERMDVCNDLGAGM